MSPKAIPGVPEGIHIVIERVPDCGHVILTLAVSDPKGPEPEKRIEVFAMLPREARAFADELKARADEAEGPVPLAS
jgi:hypothetical protein